MSVRGDLYIDGTLLHPLSVLLESIATIPREPCEAWSDYAARREIPRSMFPCGFAGEIMFREHLAWLAGEGV